MKTSRMSWCAIFLVFCLLVARESFATNFMELESTYLGNGWFQYRMKELFDPFFLEADITSLGIDFTNPVAEGPVPANWTTNSYDLWSYAGTYPQPRPNEQTFLVRSSETSYKLGARNATSLFSLITSEIFPGNTVSQNIVGYANVPCLVPCPPDEADNSPTNYLYVLKLIPDLTIKNLIYTNGEVYGLTFDWFSDSTVLLQASPDLSAWTNIAYIWGDSPETTWTTNRSLSGFGQYFRLLLAAGFHTTNVPPLSQSTSLRASALTRNTPSASGSPKTVGCREKNGVISVELATAPNETGEVRALSASGTIVQRQSFTAAGTFLAVDFNADDLPNPVFFQAVKN